MAGSEHTCVGDEDVDSSEIANDIFNGFLYLLGVGDWMTKLAGTRIG